MAKGETDERLTSPEIDRRRCWNDVGGIWRSIESKRLPVARSLSRRVADVSPSSLFPPDIPPRVVEIFTVSTVTVWLRRPGRRASVLVAPFSLVAVKHTHRTERREATSVRPTDQRRNREGCKRDESREEQRASTGRSSALLCRTTTESSG